MARAVQSTSVPSNNVLLKVTVPKRTGRKRKIGSNEPFTDASEAEETQPSRRTAKDLLRSLSDNPSNYQIEPVGRVECTHVFRGMPTTVSLIYSIHLMLATRNPGFRLLHYSEFLYKPVPGPDHSI
jgi:general transcription factor 3C polypeptide 5 (transcription factor C subunit 1)